MFQSKRPKKLFSNQKRSRLPVSLVILGLLVLIFLLIPEPDLGPLEVPASFTPKPTLAETKTSAPPPTFTALPLPTGAHGGRIIFTCTRGDYNQICMVNPDGSGLLQLTDERANHYYPSFSPQGEAIIFASNRSRGTFDLYLMVFSTSRLFALTDEIGNVFSPEFSPDGRQILFINRTSDGPTGLWIIERDGSNPHLVYGGPNYAGPNTLVAADWSPDGKTIALAMTVNQPYEYEIFLMDSTGNQEPERLATGLLGIGGSVDWSPDGNSLVVAAGPPGDKDIYNLDLLANTIARLTFGGNNNSPAFSPDGQWVAFNSLRNGGQADIYAVRADGTDERQITDHPEPDWQPAWEP